MSDKENTTKDNAASGAAKTVDKTKSKRKKSDKYKFLSIANLHNLRTAQVFKYILKLHKHMRKLIRKLDKYKKKFKKLKCNQPTSVKSDSNSSNGPTDSNSTKCKESGNFLDEIKEAAQNCQNHTDFVYEPTSGLYYDTKTGYYYNAEHGLYYDGNTGCYYSYNQDEHKFEFHSQVCADEPATSKSNEQTNADDTKSERRKSPNTRKSRSARDRKRDERPTERSRSREDNTKWIANLRRSASCDSSGSKEDGELSDDGRSDDSVVEIPDSTDDSQSKSSYNSDEGQNTNRKYQDIAKKYPPSLRIIVQETNLPKLKIGELFLITYKGGTLGREGEHDVIIPDINCSKFHLRFVYDENKSEYRCTDLGSRNGTLLNSTRMSSAQQESEPMLLVHGAVLQIGRTKLLCHIHDGHTTCGHCEPGLLEVAETIPEATISKPAVMTKQSISQAHKDELKKLKKRYGLEDDNYTEPRVHGNNRAAQRRKEVGSTNEHEKTQVASTETSIANDNKGFRMLAKMGWSEGNTLGKNDSGLLEPIPIVSNEGTKGLGCTDMVAPTNARSSMKSVIWSKAQERYKEANKKKTLNIFEDASDSE